MTIISGLGPRARAFFSDIKGPWGPSGGNEPEDGDQPKAGGPWGETPKRKRGGSPSASRNVTSLDDFLRKSRERFGGDGGGFQGGPSSKLIKWAILGLVLAWLIFTSFHVVAPGERGVVTQFGRYSRTLGPGVGMTLPAPIERVQTVDVENIRTREIGSASTETLMLTGDQNNIQGIAIRQADPPQSVNEAFKEVTAAQQDAQSYINRANAYATQLTQKAQGEAASFDKVYEEYRLAPEVTRRRMYYETMEQILQKVPKTIIEAPGVTPYLPLPEVQRQTQEQHQQQRTQQQQRGGGQ